MKNMGYHATLRYGNSAWGATGFRRVGSTTVGRGAPVRARRVAGGGGPHVGRDADDRLPLVCGLEGRRPAGPERRGASGPEAAVDGGGVAGLDGALRRGAPAHGFKTDLWTLPRVAAVIERRTGVRYHPGHVWYLLRRLNWSLQRPARRARERDETAIRQWVRQRWPAVKKRPAASGPGSSSRTKADSRRSPSFGGRGRPVAKPQS